MKEQTVAIHAGYNKMDNLQWQSRYINLQHMNFPTPDYARELFGVEIGGNIFQDLWNPTTEGFGEEISI